jgi:hypothetical protein
VAALRASVMSVMRDIAVIDSVGSVIGRQGK